MELNFITFTNPAETRRAENRRYIRTQVLRKYHAKRRSAKQKAQNEQSQRALAPRGDEEESSDTYGSTIQLYSALALIQSPSPDTYLAAGLVDSFSAFPIVLSEHDRFFLDRYIDFANSLDTLIDVTRKKRPIMTNYLPAAVKDPITLSCLLLTGAQCLEKSDQGQQSHHNARHYAGYYRGRLLHSMNQALNDMTETASDSMIAALVKLETDEYLEGNHKSFDLHANALRRVVDLCGGLETLGMQGFLADLVLRVDQAAASYFASEPYFPQPLPLQIAASIDAINAGFLSEPVLSNLSEDIIALLNDMCTLSDTMNNNQGDLPDSGPLSWEAAAECEKCLMILCAQRKTSPNRLAVPDIQEIVCLAAELFWMRVVRNYTANTYGGPLASKDLLKCMNRLLATERHQHSFHGQFLDLLLWVSFMGSLALDTAEGIREWAEMISLVSLKLGIRTWEEARPILKTFLWLDHRSEALGIATWESVKSLYVS